MWKMGNSAVMEPEAPCDSSSSKSYLTGQYALAAAAASFIWGSLGRSGRLSRLGAFGFNPSSHTLPVQGLQNTYKGVECKCRSSGLVFSYSYRAAWHVRLGYPAPPHLDITMGAIPLPDRLESARSTG